MGIARTQLTKEYTDVRRYEMFVTNKYKLPLYAFSVIDANGNSVVLKYYILSQDLGAVIKGYNSNPIKAYTVKQNSSITCNGSFLDYVFYNNETYISSTLILRSADLIGWGIDMDDLIRDIQNATIAEEMNYAEAVRDFSDYEVECKQSMLVNLDKVKNKVKETYQFLDEKYITDIINLVMDNAIITFTLPYNKLEFDRVKIEAVNEAFDFLEDVIRDYRKEFNQHNNITPKEEIKQTEQKIYEDYSNEIAREIDEAIAKRINVFDYLTQDNIHNFKEEMFGALISEINKKRVEDGLTQLAPDHIRTSIHYRSAYIEYGKYYKDIVNDNRYNTDEDWLMTKFFINLIFSQNAWHDEDRVRMPFLKADNATMYALLTESRYKGLLKSKVFNVLLQPLHEQYPEYKMTNDEWHKVLNFFTEKLYRPER